MSKEIERREKFSKLLGAHLDKRKRSAKWLAEEIGVSPSTVSRWLNEETVPQNIMQVTAIVEALDLDGPDRAALYHVYVRVQDADSLMVATLEVGNDPLPQEASDQTVTETQIHADDEPRVVSDNQAQDTLHIQKREKFISRNRVFILVGVVALGLLGWGFSKIIFAPRIFAISEWHYTTLSNSPPSGTAPNGIAYESLLTEQLRRAFYQKLNAVDELQSFAQSGVLQNWEAFQKINIWLEGYSEVGEGEITLEVDVYERGRGLIDTISRPIATSGDFQDNPDIALDRAYDLLVVDILDILKIPVGPETFTLISRYPTQSDMALRLNNEAALLVEQGNLRVAKSILENALTYDPKYADAHNNLGRVDYLLEDYEAAAVQHKLAVDAQPENSIYHVNLALAYTELGQLDQAIKSYESALRYEPADTRIFNNLSYTLLLAGNLARAKQIAQQGLGVDPDSPFLHKNLGRIYLEEEVYDAAVEHLQLAIDLYSETPAFAEALFYLALANNVLGDTEAACTVLTNYTAVAAQDEWDHASRVQELIREFKCP